MRIWIGKPTASVTANSSADNARWKRVRSSRKRSRKTYTAIAPIVIPNRAIEMARNAKWYQVTTLKMRVRRISSRRVARVTRKRAA